MWQKSYKRKEWFKSECRVCNTVKTCGKAENDEAKSGNDEAKGVPGRRGVTEGDGTM